MYKKRFRQIWENRCSYSCAYPKSKGWGTKFENLEEDFLMEDIKNQLGSAIIFSKE